LTRKTNENSRGRDKLSLTEIGGRMIIKICPDCKTALTEEDFDDDTNCYICEYCDGVFKEEEIEIWNNSL